MIVEIIQQQLSVDLSIFANSKTIGLTMEITLNTGPHLVDYKSREDMRPYISIFPTKRATVVFVNTNATIFFFL